MALADAFKALFLMADVDRDGRVSGAEAINFFRAAPDLSQPTLAKIWEFACKGQAGFLTRQEFYNALKLATVAQTGRQLTPELVKAALIGPAAAQIPPPRMIPTEAAPVAPPSANLVESAQVGICSERQPQPTPLQAHYNDQQYCISQFRSGGVAMRQNHDAPAQAAVDSNAVFSLGSDVSVKVPQPSIAKPGQLLPTFNAKLDGSTNFNESRAVSPPNFQLVGGSNQADEISSRGYDGRQQLAAPTLKPSWPKMTPSDVQRFVHVFRQVDTDHDGKVTGEQARQLFLSWQLPREVLRHVWNLSDEDCDSMLSVREFCTAVYLLERFTEGWPMPSRLPRGIHLDEPLTVVKKLGDLPLTDFVGQSSVSECALSSTSARLPQTPGKVERASCLPHNSQTLHGNAHLTKQNRESEEQTMLTEPEKIVPPKVHFKSQCENKLAEMTEKVIVLKHEANTLDQQYHEKLMAASDVETEIAAQGSTLRHIQEKKTDLSRALLKLDTDLSKAPQSNLQAQFDHFAMDLQKLEKMLLVKAKSQGVEIKRELTTKAAFGWQPNIQAKAAEWKKDWETTFHDEGFVEVEESHINPTSEASLVAMSPEEGCAAAAAAYGNVEPGHCAALDCRLGHVLNIPPAHEDQSGSVKESPAAAASSSVPVTIASTQSMPLPVSRDRQRSVTNGSFITEPGFANFNQPPIAAVGTLTRDAPVIHPGIGIEAAIETLTAASGAKPSAGAEDISSKEIHSSIASDALRGNETIQKMEQNDDQAGSSIRASWELQHRVQSPAEINAARRELRSRGSFEPEDYFDLSPRDLGMPAPSSGGYFLAYTIKEPCGSSPIFTSSTKPPFNTLIQTNPVPGLPVFDESGSNAASPSVLGK